jgi:hypothetical protein
MMWKQLLSTEAGLLLTLLLFIYPHTLSAQNRKTGDFAGIPTTDRGTANWLERSTAKEVAWVNSPWTLMDSSSDSAKPMSAGKRSWIGRHPVLFGCLVGFGAGFLVGYLPGDDGIFYDFTTEFNGLVLGGVGAGGGALIGYAINEAMAKPLP